MYSSVVSLLVLLSTAQCANILGVFLFPSISHQVVYQTIWRELSLRGHTVTVVTPDPLNDSSLTNLTEISVRFTYDIVKKITIQDTLFKGTSPIQRMDDLFKLMDVIGEAELNSAQFKQLIGDKSKHFDLILTECFHPLMYSLAWRFKAPIVGVSSMGPFITGYDVVGNPGHPILYPDVILYHHTKNPSLWQKFESVLYSLWIRYHYQNVVVPRAHQIAQKYFGEDVPYIGDLERNVSLLLLNVNPLIYPPRANVPAIVQMGQIHIKPAKPLPQDLQSILDQAKDGAIYFSLGSNVASVNIDENLKNNIIGALSELPYKVIWKWESDHFPEKPDNVITRKWFPQQDILAHPNIRAFVTQGGLQSTEEAIFREVPMVGMPFLADQPLNMQKIVELGIGLEVDYSTVTKDELKRCIIEVAENSKYKKRIKEVRDLLYDKPMAGLDTAVWWLEYVIRHKGATHLRSPMADISWFDYLLLDVVSVVVFAGATLIYLIFKVAQFSLSYKTRKLKYQ